MSLGRAPAHLQESKEEVDVLARRPEMTIRHDCNDTPLMTIRMRVAGRDLVFKRCSVCESNIWRDEAGVVPLTRVLEIARAR